MVDHLSDDDFITELYMVREGFPGAIIVTEGGSDIKFFEKFSNSEKARYLPAWGKEKAISVSQYVQSNKLPGIIVIIDADFLHIEKDVDLPEITFLTDFHDIEVVLFFSSALEGYLLEVCSKEKMKAFIKSKKAKDIREAIVNSVYPYSKLKYLSHVKKYFVAFQDLNLEKCINKENLTLDVKKVFQQLFSINSDKDSVKKLEKTFHLEEAKINHDPRHLCNGHDICRTLGVASRKAIGSINSDKSKREVIESSLRLSFGEAEFKSLKMVSQIKDWEKKNPKYEVFKA